MLFSVRILIYVQNHECCFWANFLLLFVFGMQYDVLIANNELVKIVDPTLKGGGAKFNFSGLNLVFFVVIMCCHGITYQK